MRRRFRRVVVLGVTGAVIAAGAGTAYATMSSSGPDYRLATATSGHVSAALDAVGTLTPVRNANVAFPIAGSVATVAVKTGQHVAVGQTLGSLDTTSLQAKLTAAQSTLASANAKVNSDIASQDAATATPTASPTAQSGSAALLSAQRKADAALRQADTALGQAKKACGPSPSVTPTPTPIATPTSRTTSTVAPPTGAPSGTATPTAWAPSSHPTSSPAGPSCAAAEQKLLDAETAVMKAQQALAKLVTKLAKSLTNGSTAHSGSSGSGTAVPSAAQLAADQASAAAAAAEVTVAEQNLAAATVVSPVSGTVVTVSATKGSNIGAGSTAFVVAGLDSYEVVTAVSVTDMPKVKVGQKASVEPDGMHTPLSGSVVSIGLVPTTSGSSTTYPVTVGLEGSETGLHAGGNASVTITTSRSSGVSVPTSAVHSLGRFTTVTVYAGGKTQVTRVTVGTVGAVLTQITSGLKVGQQVVLADLNQPLPTNNLPGRFARRGPGLARGLGG